MKKNFIPLVMALVIWACNNHAEQKTDVADTSIVEEETFLWQATLDDSTGKLVMAKSESAGIDTMAAQPVINFINQDYPNIILKLSRISNDTMYVKIDDARFLTQQMGSTGPMMYLSAAVYNLTEVPGIKYVNFDFEVGDHASPGTYTRDTFREEMK